MSARTNKSLDKKQAIIPSNVNAIANIRKTTVADILLQLARQQLTAEANKGKDTFLAIVTKVIDGHLTDPFLNQSYESDRVDGTTKELQKSHKIVLLHVPALHTFYTEFERDSEKKKGEVLSTDLYKISCVTNLKVSVGDIVNVKFDDINSLSNPRITERSTDERKRLTTDITKFLKSKDVMKNELACKLLGVDEAQGYAIKTKTFLNARNPRYGYAGFYTAFNDYAKKSEIINQIVRNKTSSELAELGLSDNLSSKEAVKELNNNSKYNFSLSFKASQPVFNYIESSIKTSKSENVKNLAASGDITGRVISLQIETDNDKLRQYIVEYVKSVVVDVFNYGWSTTSKDYKIDIFGKPGIDKTLFVDDKSKTKLPIEYSTKLENKSRKSAAEPDKKTDNSPLQSTTPANEAQTQATTQATPIAKPKQDIPNCEEATSLNDNIYTNVKKQTNLTSVQKDNKKYESLNLTLQDWFNTGLLQAVKFDFNKNFKPTTIAPRGSFAGFSYSKNDEVISGFPESFKQNSLDSDKKKQKKPTKPKQTGTNFNKIVKNLGELVLFCRELTKLIATNEGLPLERVIVFPISVFRKFEKPRRKKDGKDDNSRHYFGRAIDFTVYISLNDNLDLKSKKLIPIEDTTFEIPNTIVYLYVLQLLRLQRDKFGTCGLALLRRGTRRTSGYVHYEYMRETTTQNVGLLLNRRWVSKPTGKKDTSVFGQAFGQIDSDKDAIIKGSAVKDIKSKLGFLPEKIENLI